MEKIIVEKKLIGQLIPDECVLDKSINKKYYLPLEDSDNIEQISAAGSDLQILYYV